jgi:hypothetical protein
MPLDEGTAWITGMNMYRGGRGNDRQFWLSIWSGKPILVDRVTQGGVPTTIPRPFINVIGNVTPDLLTEFADHKGRRDGFLDRILFVFPQAHGSSDWNEATLSDEAREAWKTIIASLSKLQMHELEDGIPGYKEVKLSPAAKQAWICWYNAHGAEMRSSELPPELIGPWAKLINYAARLTLLLHYLWLPPADDEEGDDEEGDVGPASVERAVRLIDYFKSHLRLVYSRLRQTPENREIANIIAWVRRKGGRCTARQLLQAHKVANAEKAKKLLKEIAEHGDGRLEWLDAKNNKKVLWLVLEPA